jgi:hypothetical protein
MTSVSGFRGVRWRAHSRRQAKRVQVRVDAYMVFDVKLGENYRRKVRLVADGHKTDAPTSTITYSSVVSKLL